MAEQGAGTVLAPRRYTDDEGNEWTEDEIRQASDQMARDEMGQGSFGGVAADEEGNYPTTAQAAEVELPVSQPRARRELNPRKFGEFFKSNIFGGLGGEYITGKRPMTLFDYATDVLAAYGGENIGRRNASIINADTARRKADVAAATASQAIATGRAQERKATAQVGKLASEAISQMMVNLDSDLWMKEMGAIAKEHGVTLRPGTVGMVQRMAQEISASGARSPAEILQDPDAYDPALVNRVRHTMNLLSKNIETSESRRLQSEQAKAALGMREGPESRKQEEFATKVLGVERALDLLVADTKSENPETVRAAKGRIAAILEGGTARQKVLEEMSGVREVRGRYGEEYRDLRVLAEEELLKEGNESPTRGEVAQRVQDIRNRTAAQRAAGVRVQEQITKGRKLTSDALNNLAGVEEAVKKFGLAKGPAGAWATQPLKVAWKAIKKDPDLARLSGIDAIMGTFARSISQEVGVLTQQDIDRIKIAVKPRLGVGGDTVASYMARLNFVKEMVNRANKSIAIAERTGKFVPVVARDITFEGDPNPPTQEERSGRSTSLPPHETVKAMYDYINSFPEGSEERKRARQEALAKVRGGVR